MSQILRSDQMQRYFALNKENNIFILREDDYMKDRKIKEIINGKIKTKNQNFQII